MEISESPLFFVNIMIDKLISIISNIVYALLLLVNIYALVVAVLSGAFSPKKLGRFWRARHLRKVWGIKNGDDVIVVCSELDEPEKRQNVEPREFIYNLKYGDVDAYFEVIVTLLRLFPNIKLKVLSAGEAESTRIDLARHLILIGGPDYNSMTDRILQKGITRYAYKIPGAEDASEVNPDEIVIYDKKNDRDFCELTDKKDYGYFERIVNPDNPKTNVILLGGCHAIGVTGAAKAFSMVESEQGEIPKIVLKNAKMVAKMISRETEFSVLVPVERFSQTIKVPLIKENDVTVKRRNKATVPFHVS